MNGFSTWRAWAIVVATSLMMTMTATDVWADGGTQRWESAYREGEPAYSTDVTTSPNGATVFVTGGTDTTNKNSHIGTVAYDAGSGKQRWAAEFPSKSDPEAGLGRLVAASPDGNKLFVSGVTFCRAPCSGKPYDGYATIAYDAATGERLWVARYDSAGGGAYDLSVSPDGSRVYVAGSSDGGLSSLVVAYSAATGTELWKLERPSGLADRTAMGLSLDGSTVYMADPAPALSPPQAPCFSSGGGYRTVALNAVDGSPIWTSTYTNGSQSCGLPTDLAASSDGQTVFLTGADHADAGNYGSQTIALDATSGNLVWDVDDPRILTTGGDSKVSLGLDPDGSKVVVYGNRCEKPAFGCDEPIGSTMAYSASTGASLWASTYSGGGQLYATALTIAPDGSSAYVSGQETMPCYSPCETGAQTNAPLVAYDLDSGAERWASTDTDSYTQALAVSPDSRSIFTAGASTGSTDALKSAAARAGTGCSNPCGYSTSRANTGPGRGQRQDDAVLVAYDGWRGHFHKAASGGAYRASRSRGDTAIFTTPAASMVAWLTMVGPTGGKAKVVVDGRSRGVIDLYSATAAARSVTYKGLKKTSHTVKIKVLGRPGAGSTGKTVAIDGFTYNAQSGVVQESASGVRYNSWSGRAVKGASGGSIRTTSQRSAKASLEFTGRRIVWITATGPTLGRAKVVIDGKARTVDLYRPRPGNRAKFVFKGLSKGDHSITVSPLGTKNRRSSGCAVAIDAFMV
jgi:Tol biopolymer transport system component